MKTIFLYEPSIASNNLGDYIIVEAVKTHMNSFLKDNYVVEFPTHTPLSNRYWLTFFRKTPPDYKFVCGSNIIVGKINQMRHIRQWMLGYSTTWQTYNSIFVGVGAQLYQKCNYYTKHEYRKMFRKDYIHSVRDEYTEKFLKSIGVTNVINTGCPTMWSLTREHCSKIPTVKAGNVIFTLTDYDQNPKRDEFFINVLLRNYSTLYFWPQGNRDYQYLMTLKGSDKIKIISASLQGYDTFLLNNDVDYIGTRLHGGIRALQKGKRSLIIGIDNRAKELSKDFGVPVLNQENIEKMEELINTRRITEIKLNEGNIEKFLSQFEISRVE